MKKIDGFTKRMVAILLSGMLAVGTIPVTALATEVQENNVQEEEAITTYTVTLDANGGYFENERDDVQNVIVESAEVVNKLILIGESVTTLPTRENAVFKGWSLERDGKLLTQEKEEYIPEKDCVLYAVWEIEESANDDNSELSEGTGTVDTAKKEGIDNEATDSQGNANNSDTVDSDITDDDKGDSEDPLEEESEEHDDSDVALPEDSNSEEVQDPSDNKSESEKSLADDYIINEDTVVEKVTTISNNAVVSSRKENGVFVGELGDNNELDGYLYEWADGCYTPYAANELSNCVFGKNKTVVYKLENGKITKFARLVSVLSPTVWISSPSDTFLYQNGAYDKEKFEINIQLHCELKNECPFTSWELRDVEGVQLTIKQIEYKLNSNLLNFGKKGVIFQKTLTETYDKNVTVSFGNDVGIAHDVYINKDIVPENVNTIVEVTANILDDQGNTIDVGAASITVGNIDLQKQIVDDNKQMASYNQELQYMRSQLNAAAAVTIDPSLNGVFTTTQIKQIEQFLTIYFSHIIYASEYKKKGLLSKIGDAIIDRLEDRILDKLGVSKHSFLFCKSTSFRVQVKGTSKNGNDITIEFNGTIDNYISGDDAPFGTTIYFKHKILDMDAVPAGTPETGTAMAVFYNMESFAKSMISYIKAGYSVAWGDDADQLASMIISKPINELLLNGSFSDSLYDFTVNKEIKMIKKYSIHCPVDVYVYDENGELCGSIIDNRIDKISDEVVLSVCEDHKYIYSAGGTYTLKLAGTGNGKLNYIVDEFSGDEVVRTAKVKDAALSTDSIYTTVITDIPFVDHDVYSLCDNTNNTDYPVSEDTYIQNEQNNSVCVAAGSCGEEARYSLYSDGTLFIHGKGSTSSKGVYINDSYSVVDLHVLDGITSIGDSFFNYYGVNPWNYSPVSVTLSDSVTYVGVSSFNGCENLETVIIGSGLKNLGECAFSYCPSLKQIIVSPSNQYFTTVDGALYAKDLSAVYKIPNQQISTYTIPEGVKTVGADSFGNLENLKKVVFPTTVKIIDDYAFDGCSSLNNVELPAGLESIEYRAFKSCTDLSNITIPEGVTEIQSEAFLGCKDLKSVVIPKSVNTIGSYALGYSSSSITANEEVQKTDGFTIYGYSESAAMQYALDNGFSFVSLDNPQQPYESQFISLNQTIEVQIDSGEITKVGFTPDEDGCYLFYSTSDTDTYGYLYDDEMIELTSDDDSGDDSNFLIRYMMSAGDTYYIGVKCYGSDSSMVIPITAKLESKGTNGTCGENAVWSYDKSTCSLTISGTGNVSTSSVWEGFKDKVNTIVIEEGVTGIDANTFYDFSGLIDVSIPDSVSYIGDFAFSWCKKLTKVAISESLISEYAEGFMNTPWFNAVIDKKLALSIYDRYLKDRGGEFCILNVTNDDIPDLLFKDSPNSYTLYINGSYMESVYYGSEEDTLLFSYYPSKNFYKICEDEQFPTYYTTANENGMIGCYECLSAVSYGYFEGYISDSEGGQTYNNNLGKWIDSSEISKEKYESLLLEHADGESENACIFLKNTDENRAQIIAKESCLAISIESAKAVIKNQTYTGRPISPSVTVTLAEETLRKDRDYTVTYSNNTNAGTATVTITGKGNYTGTKTATFRINKAAQNISVKSTAASVAVGRAAAVSITGNKGTKSYKSSNTAVATVTAAGKVTAKKVGTVKITATSAATANYNAASKTVTIKVVPAATASIAAANQATGIRLTWKRVAGAAGYKVYRGATLIRTIKSGATVTCTDTKANANGTRYIFKVIPYASTGNGLARSLTTYRVARPAVSSVRNSAAKKMTVRWGKNAKANGYQIQYSTSKTFASGNKALIVAGAANVSRVIGGLVKGRTYYVRIRTYKTVGKARYWSIWSPAKSVKIAK